MVGSGGSEEVCGGGSVQAMSLAAAAPKVVNDSGLVLVCKEDVPDSDGPDLALCTVTVLVTLMVDIECAVLVLV